MNNRILKLNSTYLGLEMCCPKLDPNFFTHQKGIEHNKACIFI